MNQNVVVIGIGNSYRRDDGVGPAVAAELEKRKLSGVRILTMAGEPAEILDAWTGARRAVVVDAAMTAGSIPGRIRRWSPEEMKGTAAVVSSHALGLPQTYALGEALGRLPDELTVFTVDAADASDGVGLTPAVAVVVPELVSLISAYLCDERV
ncbi:MAG TPA: hydrogenase maturation protease [Mycobacterium sp.]|jgi:hydrogenase maturation protease